MRTEIKEIEEKKVIKDTQEWLERKEIREIREKEDLKEIEDTRVEKE